MKNLILFVIMVVAVSYPPNTGTAATEGGPFIWRQINAAKHRIPVCNISPVEIIIGHTENHNPEADARWHNEWLKNPGRQVSWHITIDDEMIIQHLPYTAGGFHSGGKTNCQSVFIMLTDNEGINREKQRTLLEFALNDIRKSVKNLPIRMQ